MECRLSTVNRQRKTAHELTLKRAHRQAEVAFESVGRYTGLEVPTPWGS